MAEKDKSVSVTFVTRFKGLELVHTPMGTKDKVGNKVPSVRCSFMPSAFGYTYTTSNPELVDWLKAHKYMQEGKIELFDPAMAKVRETTQVSRGGVTTATGKDQVSATAPAERATEPRPAVVRK